MEFKTNMKFNFALVLFFLVLIMCSGMILAADSTTGAESKNLTSEQQAVSCMAESRQIRDELASNDFNTERVNDTITQAEALYNDILKKKKSDFSLVISSCDEIKKIKELAYNSRDGIDALKKFYNESVTSVMDTSETDALISSIEKEISDERYEKVEQLIDNAYEKIIELKSSYTTLEILRRNTRNALVRFVTENWQIKLITLIILVVLFFAYRTRIEKAIINRRLNSLDIRKKTLKDLIKQTQKDYFEYGKLPEGTYNIRTKKFAEMIRDIDRQIPLLQEELAKLEKQKNLKLAIFARKK